MGGGADRVVLTAADTCRITKRRAEELGRREDAPRDLRVGVCVTGWAGTVLAEGMRPCVQSCVGFLTPGLVADGFKSQRSAWLCVCVRV